MSKIPKPTSISRSHFHWQMSVKSSFEKESEFKDRLARMDAAIAFFNSLTYEQQKHIKLLEDSARREGYEDAQSFYGDGP